MHLARCQINPIYVNFHIQKSDSLWTRSEKCSPSCQLGLIGQICELRTFSRYSTSTLRIFLFLEEIEDEAQEETFMSDYEQGKLLKGITV